MNVDQIACRLDELQRRLIEHLDSPRRQGTYIADPATVGMLSELAALTVAVVERLAILEGRK